MAVKIRLRRMGAKKAPFYRIVVADSRYPRDGRFIEEIGYYNRREDRRGKGRQMDRKRRSADGYRKGDFQEERYHQINCPLIRRASF